MTQATAERPDRPAREERFGSPAVGAIAVWLLIQLTTLGLGAARVPLWYGAPDPAERVAAAQMLAVQLITSALLFPWLMRNLATSACVILVSAPFAQLAGMLAQTEPSRLARAWAYAAIWMSALAAWAGALRSSRERLAGVAVAVVLTIGVPVLRYLRFEFSPSVPAGVDPLRHVDAVALAMSQLQRDAVAGRAWALPLAVLVVGVIFARSRSRDKLSTGPIHNAVD